MSADVVHNPQACIGSLSRVSPRGKADAEAIRNAIACMNYMQNVIQRQRKQLTDLQAKLVKFGFGGHGPRPIRTWVEGPGLPSPELARPPSGAHVQRVVGCESSQGDKAC